MRFTNSSTGLDSPGKMFHAAITDCNSSATAFPATLSSATYHSIHRSMSIGQARKIKLTSPSRTSLPGFSGTAP
jgi:hypothetical protein